MGVHYLVLCLFIVFPISIIISYIIAVKREDIVPLYSYISDTGTHPPQSCILGQFFNILAALFGVIAYIRYKQIEEYFYTDEAENEITKTQCVLRLNSYALIIGMISSLGVSVVGNFQETNVLSVHLIGAVMAFGIGSVYLILQAILSFKLLPAFGSKGLAVLRTFLGIICLILFVMTLGGGVAAALQFTGENFTKWKPEDGGWELHVMSVVCEWLMAVLFNIFIVTLMVDFRKIKYHAPQIRMRFEHRRKGEMTKADLNGNQAERKTMLPISEPVDDNETSI